MQIDRCAYAVVEEDNDELGAVGDAGVRGRVAEVFRRPNPRQTPGTYYHRCPVTRNMVRAQVDVLTGRLDEEAWISC